MTEEKDNPLISDLSGLGKIADSKVAQKAYDDALAPLMKQLGEFGEDVVKTGRLLLFPLKITAFFHDRIAKWAKQISDDVPKERQQEAPPEITGPALQNLYYMDDENPLIQLYLELLKRAIDKDRCDEAHPAYIKIIEQLAPEEAMILFQLQKAPIEVKTSSTAMTERLSLRYQHATDFKSCEIPFSKKTFLLLDHLQSVDLVTHFTKGIVLTTWGEAFANACMPEDFTLDSPLKEID